MGSVSGLTDNGALGTYMFTTAYSNFLNGTLDEVAIINAPLTALEVMALARAAGTAYRAEVISDSPVGYWPLDEASGGSAPINLMGADAGSFGSGVTFAQSPLSPNAGGGSSILIDGTSDATSRIDLGLTTLNTAAFTVEFLLYNTAWPWNGLDEGFIMSKNSWYSLSNTDFPFAIRLHNNGTLETNFSKGDDGGYDLLTYDNLRTLNEVHHVAIVYKATDRVEIWIDGIKVRTESIDFTISSNSRPICLGAPALANGGGVNQGYLEDTYIDEVAVFDTDLSAARIEAHYAALDKR